MLGLSVSSLGREYWELGSIDDNHLGHFYGLYVKNFSLLGVHLLALVAGIDALVSHLAHKLVSLCISINSLVSGVCVRVGKSDVHGRKSCFYLNNYKILSDKIIINQPKIMEDYIKSTKIRTVKL